MACESQTNIITVFDNLTGGAIKVVRTPDDVSEYHRLIVAGVFTSLDVDVSDLGTEGSFAPAVSPLTDAAALKINKAKYYKFTLVGGVAVTVTLT